MTKDEYLTEKAILNNRLNEIEKRKDILNRDYLNTNALPYEAKLKITSSDGKVQFVYVAHRHVDFQSWEAREGIVYSFKKLNKDGSCSPVNAYVFQDDKIEVVK